MSEPVDYATLFEAIGHYLDRAHAADVLVDQIEGGYLLAFEAGGEQRVVTLDEAELARLRAEAAAPRKGGGFRLFGRRNDGEGRLRGELRAVGRFLDHRRAEAVVVQQREGHFSGEFTSMPADAADLREMHRLVETLDDEALRPFR
jgi:hypothetical protein